MDNNIINDNTSQTLSTIKIEDIKSMFYLMNGKPDTSIQLLKGRKKITITEIKELNEDIQRKLENHYLIGQISSINLIFNKGKIKDYGSWEEFERESWNLTNNKTEAISLSWDILLKLPNYQNPQRHTLKVKIGQSLSPKDMMDLFMNSDNKSEIDERMADGVVKIDFIDSVIANELIEKVSNWYDCLTNIPNYNNQFIKTIIKNQKLLANIIHYFIPIVCLFIFHKIIYDGGNLDLSITNIQISIIYFLGIYFIFLMIGKKIADLTYQKINGYEKYNVFEITKGDRNSIDEITKDNKNITNEILGMITKSILGLILPFILKYLWYIFNK